MRVAPVGTTHNLNPVAQQLVVKAAPQERVTLHDESIPSEPTASRELASPVDLRVQFYRLHSDLLSG